MSDREKVYLSQLEEIQILWPGDVRKLAEFVLRCCDARDVIANAKNESTQTSRPTIHGLATDLARITQVPGWEIEQQFKSHGFSLAATAEYDLVPLAVIDKSRVRHTHLDCWTKDESVVRMTNPTSEKHLTEGITVFREAALSVGDSASS